MFHCFFPSFISSINNMMLQRRQASADLFVTPGSGGVASKLPPLQSAKQSGFSSLQGGNKTGEDYSIPTGSCD
jgi:hypothetical protein